MPVICPTITAENTDEYREQVERVASFAHRIQIDLTDGKFAPSQTVLPSDAWWPVGMKADIHLMYRNPKEAITKLVVHKPNLIIVHAESEGNFEQIAHFCHNHSIKVGLALLPETVVDSVLPALDMVDHVMIFSGNLGYQGGSQANLALLDKVAKIKQTKPNIEIGWDGGINLQNVSQLVFGGVDVLNVGGFIQHAQDPERAFHSLARVADETGTT